MICTGHQHPCGRTGDLGVKTGSMGHAEGSPGGSGEHLKVSCRWFTQSTPMLCMTLTGQLEIRENKEQEGPESAVTESCAAK